MTTDHQPEQVHDQAGSTPERERSERTQPERERSESHPRGATRTRGPNAPTMLAAVVFLLIAASAAIVQAREITVDWSRVGPGALIGGGIVLVLAGALGLLRRR